jgi:DNA-binding transcriptional MocR family regulator
MSGCRLKLVTVQTVPDRAFCARALLCAFRARHAYRERRGLLLDPLTGRFPRLQVSGAAGMRRLLPLPGQTDDTILAQAAAARGIGITALSPLHLARSPDRGLLLGFGRLPNHKIPAAVDALWSVLSQAGAASTPQPLPGTSLTSQAIRRG